MKHLAKLTDLEPEWMRVGGSDSPITAANAQGVMFLCPQCFAANSGPVGTHMVLCWFRGRGVPDDESPGPGRWMKTGSDFENLTLQPSVNLPGDGCKWHGYVTKGQATG